MVYIKIIGTERLINEKMITNIKRLPKEVDEKEPFIKGQEYEQIEYVEVEGTFDLLTQKGKVETNLYKKKNKIYHLKDYDKSQFGTEVLNFTKNTLKRNFYHSRNEEVYTELIGVQEEDLMYISELKAKELKGMTIVTPNRARTLNYTIQEGLILGSKKLPTTPKEVGVAFGNYLKAKKEIEKGVANAKIIKVKNKLKSYSYDDHINFLM